MPIDYVRTMGVKWVEDTEDFLERIGHLGEPDAELRIGEDVSGT